MAHYRNNILVFTNFITFLYMKCLYNLGLVWNPKVIGNKNIVDSPVRLRGTNIYVYVETDGIGRL